VEVIGEILPRKLYCKECGMCEYVRMSPLFSSKCHQVSAWYGVSALSLLASRTLLSSVIRAPAARALVYVVLACTRTAIGALPVIAELQAEGVDEPALWSSAAGSGGLVVPQKLALALVDIVGKVAEAQSASMVAS
jgi:hypothetical protein